MSEVTLSFRPGAITAAQWRQIVQSATDTAIISTDPEGRVTSWNEGACRILGWSEEEMLGRSLACLFEDRGQLGRELRDAARRGRGGGEEGWRLRKDGSRVWATGEMSPIRGDDSEIVGFVKILRDRTAQRQAEEAVAEERRMLAVLNRAGSGIAAETELERLVQIVADAGVELSGAEFGAFFYRGLDETGESQILRALAGAPPAAFAAWPPPRRTELFAPTFGGDGIVRSDDVAQDPRLRANALLKGLPLRSYLAVPVVSRNGEALGELVFGHAAPGVFTERSERGLEGLAAEAAVAIDNVRLSQATLREVAERRRAEEALRELNANLEQLVEERTEQLRANEAALRQSQKMEAVGQLTGGVAHDFNNLLQVITGNLDTVLRHLPPDSARLRRAAGQALKGARRAASLTQRLLAFSRRQPLDPKPLDVNALVTSLSELIHRTLGETVAVETALATGLWQVEADANELEAAILNLAVNARDAMLDGGRLTIETANAQFDEAGGRYTEMSPGEYVLVAVSDTGKGMDEATIARAFEPFFTTKPVGRGTGLGLSQVYGFVKQSGGNVKIYSEVGHGTTVKIYLPRLAHASLPLEEDEPEAPPPDADGDETILLIEDDDDVRAYSVETLRELGYQVLEAGDGPSALQVLEHQPRVDLLFTDVVLPGGMTGAQIAELARSLRPGLKVLFTTGYARNALMHQGRLERGVRLITKPFGSGELASKVRDVLDE